MSLNLSNPDRTIHAGIILMGETEILDVAPLDFLNGLTPRFINVLPIPDELKAKALNLDFHWVTEKGTPAAMTSNITIQATDSFESCPRLDIVLIGAYNIGYTPNEAELSFVRKAYDDSTAFLTICGGFQAAHAAGLLVNKTATAPRFMLEQLKKQDPRTTWVDRRFVRDGKLWTSGALLNGQDLIRAFTMEYWPELGSICLPVGGWPIRSIEYDGAEGLASGQVPMMEAK